MAVSALSWLAVLVILVMLLPAGLVLLAVGLRGVRVSDHPHCRACGFDLFGSAAAERCPECGTGLSRSGAVREGVRRRRPGLIVAGVVLLLPIVAVLGLGAWGAVSSIDWQRVKPVAWLRWEANASGAGAGAGAAVDELLRRQQAGELTAAQVDALIDDALAAQADAARPWDPDWGDILQTAKRDSVLDEGRWQRYAEQAVTVGSPFSLEVRPRVRRGDPIPYRLHRSAARAGDDWTLPSLWAQLGPTTVTLGELAFEHGGKSGGGLSATGSGWSGSSWRLSEAQWAQTGSGPATVGTSARVVVKEGHGDADRVLIEFDLDLSAEVEIVDEPTVWPVTDPALRQAVRDALEVERLEPEPSWGDGVPRLGGSIKIAARPVGLACQVVVVAPDGREWSLGTITVGKDRSTSYGVSGSAEGFDAAVVDLVLRPDVDAAKGDVDIEGYWDEEIRIEGVKVRTQVER